MKTELYDCSSGLHKDCCGGCGCFCTPDEKKDQEALAMIELIEEGLIARD